MIKSIKSISSITLLCTLLTLSVNATANELADCTDGHCGFDTPAPIRNTLSIEAIGDDDLGHYYGPAHNYNRPAELTSIKLKGDSIRVTLPTKARKLNMLSEAFDLSGSSSYGVSYTLEVRLLDDAMRSTPHQLLLWKQMDEIQANLSEETVDLPPTVMLGKSGGYNYLEVLTEKDGNAKVSHRIIVTDLALYHLTVDTSDVKESSYRSIKQITKGITRHLLDSMTVIVEDPSDEASVDAD